MASNATITVADGAVSPVDHDFDPVRIEGDVASYQNKVASTVSGRETLSLRLGASKAVRTTRVDLRIPKVVEETINGVTVYTAKGFATAKAEILIPLDWSAAEAKNARILLSNTLAHATVGLMVDEHEFVW